MCLGEQEGKRNFTTYKFQFVVSYNLPVGCASVKERSWVAEEKHRAELLFETNEFERSGACCVG